MNWLQENMNTIVLGDCLEVMKNIPDKSIDLVLTDPPYILDLNGGTKGGNFKRKLNCEKHINFISNDFDYKSTFSLFLQKCKIPNILVFCSNSQISRTMDYFEQKNIPTTLLVWQKPNPIPFANGKFISDCEFIVSVRGKGSYFNNSLNIKDKSKVIRMPSSDNYYHPTQKPLKLIEKLLNIQSKENDIILDCFSGSGTTAIACHNLNLNFICIEKDYDYWKASCERLDNARAQMKLF